MRRSLTILLIAAMTVPAFGAGSPPVSKTINVTATNNGVFTFNIVAATYAFGTVDAAGTANVGGDQPLTGVRGASGAVYTASGATTWTSTSAPGRTVRVFNASGAGSTITWGTADRLEMQIPVTGLGAGATSCGFKTFSTIGDGGAGLCGSGNLVHTVTVGMGANGKTGNLDFRLTVNDTDLTGSNIWIVTLTATGA